MRPHRFLLPLALLTPLALASPAVAADVPVSVTNFEFGPKSLNVEVGDTVTWNFVDSGHTATSDPGQPERWNSSETSNATGTSYPKTFSKPGRFSYYCIPHDFMTGAVVVGTDEFKKSQTKFRTVRRGTKVTFRFRLVEAAKVVASIKGPNRKKATSKRLTAGNRSISLRGLKTGRYSGTVKFTDDFDKRSKVRVSVRVP